MTVEIRDAAGATLPPVLTPLEQHLQHFHRRVLQDALLEATAAYWLRRAHEFAAVGTQVCDLVATNCQNHAALLVDVGLDEEAEGLIDALLQSPNEAS